LALSWHEVKLPPVGTSRLRAALDGVLEDRLLDEPDNLALAIGPRGGPEGRLLVAACDKAWLRGALDFFESADRPASRMVPEFSPVPADNGQPRIVATGTPEDPHVVLIDAHGVVRAGLAAAPLLLDAAAETFAEADVIAEPAVAELAEQILARPVRIRAVAEGLVASTKTPWELAQFDLAISGHGRLARRWAQAWQQFMRARRWRPVRWGLVALVAANLAGLNAWAWRQDAMLQDRREQVKLLLSQTFPGVRTIVDAPLQMERELDLLRQSSGALSSGSLETMLAAATAVLPAGLSPSGIDYAAGELTLKGLGLGVSQVADMDRQLLARGYASRIDGDRLVLRAAATP
jgi:general secretion pathway protein L